MRFSIIIPVYNRGLIVPICVRKILEANYQDFELILVDDGSSDSTMDIARRYARERIAA